MRIIVAIAFFSQWSGNGLVSYYLTKVFDQIGITGTGTQLLINGILQIWNLFWAVYASFMVDRLGRRFLFLLSAGLMTLFYMAQAICFSQYAQHGTAAAGHAVIAFIFLFYAAYDIAFTPLIVSYTVEILPYSLRAKGFNVFSFVISLALIFNQYVNPIALDTLGWKYYVSCAQCSSMTTSCTDSRPTDLDRVRLLAGIRIRLFVVIHCRDQEPDSGGDGGIVRWRGRPQSDHTRCRDAARGLRARKAFYWSGQCMIPTLPRNACLSHTLLAIFRQQVLFVYPFGFVLVSVTLPSIISKRLSVPPDMSLDMHLCIIQRSKTRDSIQLRIVKSSYMVPTKGTLHHKGSYYRGCGGRMYHSLPSRNPTFSEALHHNAMTTTSTRPMVVQGKGQHRNGPYSQRVASPTGALVHRSARHAGCRHDIFLRVVSRRFHPRRSPDRPIVTLAHLTAARPPVPSAVKVTRYIRGTGSVYPRFSVRTFRDRPANLRVERRFVTNLCHCTWTYYLKVIVLQVAKTVTARTNRFVASFPTHDEEEVWATRRYPWAGDSEIDPRKGRSGSFDSAARSGSAT